MSQGLEYSAESLSTRRGKSGPDTAHCELYDSASDQQGHHGARIEQNTSATADGNGEGKTEWKCVVVDSPAWITRKSSGGHGHRTD